MQALRCHDSLCLDLKYSSEIEQGEQNSRLFAGDSSEWQQYQLVRANFYTVIAVYVWAQTPLS